MKTPWAVILCKFADGNVEPYPLSYYQNLFTAKNQGSPWNMVKYFDDCSHGTVDLGDSQVFGWYKLSQTVAKYNSYGPAARDELISWARTAAQNDGVDLSPFFSTVVCTNLWQDIGAGSTGVVAQGHDTPFPRGLGQEMGHIYGLNHSRVDGSDNDYQDPWDIMSAFNAYTTPDPEFTYIGPILNAWNMRSASWLDESRVWSNASDTVDETITLRPLVRRDLPGYLAAELPDGYLVEFRVKEGWDGGIPRPAVLVHRYDNGHSYLMRSNLGSLDLVVGDSFGDDVPAQPTIFSAYTRVDVISINPAGHTAELRIRYHRPPDFRFFEVAIDPMYLILSGKAYQTWVEQHHPHVPRLADLEAVLRSMSVPDQYATLGRARALSAYARAVEVAVANLQRREGLQGLDGDATSRSTM